MSARPTCRGTHLRKQTHVFASAGEVARNIQLHRCWPGRSTRLHVHRKLGVASSAQPRPLRRTLLLYGHGSGWSVRCHRRSAVALHPGPEPPPRTRVPNEIGAEAAAQLTCSSVAGREDLIGREVDMNHDAGAALAGRFDGGDACDRTRGAPAAGGARKPSGARCAQTGDTAARIRRPTFTCWV